MKLILWLRSLSKTQVISYILFALSGLILAAAIFTTSTITVLKDWKLILPAGDIHAGDTVVIQSVYTKTMNVSGISTRYVECKTPSNVYVRYPVSEAVANRAASKSTGTGVVMVIPRTIPALPTTCHINITIDYEIALWRHVIESNDSRDFTLLPQADASSSAVSTVTGGEQKTSQTQSAATGPIASTGNSSFNNTPAAALAQSDISQGTETSGVKTLTPTPEPTPQAGLLSTLGGLIKKVL